MDPEREATLFLNELRYPFESVVRGLMDRLAALPEKCLTAQMVTQNASNPDASRKTVLYAIEQLRQAAVRAVAVAKWARTDGADTLKLVDSLMSVLFDLDGFRFDAFDILKDFTDNGVWRPSFFLHSVDAKSAYDVLSGNFDAFLPGCICAPQDKHLSPESIDATLRAIELKFCNLVVKNTDALRDFSVARIEKGCLVVGVRDEFSVWLTLRDEQTPPFKWFILKSEINLPGTFDTTEPFTDFFLSYVLASNPESRREFIEQWPRSVLFNVQYQIWDSICKAMLTSTDAFRYIYRAMHEFCCTLRKRKFFLEIKRIADAKGSHIMMDKKRKIRRIFYWTPSNTRLSTLSDNCIFPHINVFTDENMTLQVKHYPELIDPDTNEPIAFSVAGKPHTYARDLIQECIAAHCRAKLSRVHEVIAACDSPLSAVLSRRAEIRVLSSGSSVLEIPLGSSHYVSFQVSEKNGETILHTTVPIDDRMVGPLCAPSSFVSTQIMDGILNSLWEKVCFCCILAVLSDNVILFHRLKFGYGTRSSSPQASKLPHIAIYPVPITILEGLTSHENNSK